MPHRPLRFQTRRSILALLLTLTVCFLFRIFSGSPLPQLSCLHSFRRPQLSDAVSNQGSLSVPEMSSKWKVPLEVHIMSKCPDAKTCLHDLVVPAMQRVFDKVDFKLSYIGTATDQDDGIACMHGPTECLGNMVELCASQLYPDPKIYLGFTMCMTEQYRHIPERNLVEDCAAEHGMDFDKLNECVSDEGHALELLRESVERSANASVKVSCTVRLDENVRCVMDGGQWKNCKNGSSVDDLVRDVGKLYNATNS
ncbi:MAG: hypothetical protein M1827_002347 [Pycnora praestabilis]|nr:MAG: hypothetical protein M1827_002347 [Pycnora praestabilis]